MARKLEAKIVLTADTKKAQKDLKKTGDEFDSLATKGKELGTGLSELKTKFLAIGVAVGGIVAGFLKVISLAGEQELAVKKLDAAIGNLNGQNQALSDSLQEQASSLSKVTAASDEEILAVQQRIALFIQEEDQIKELTAITLDFAAAKDKSATEVADALVRSIVTENNALLEQGIVIEGAAGSVERYESALNSLVKFEGQSAAAADTTAGRIKNLQEAFFDLFQEIGAVITRNSEFQGGLIGITETLRSAETRVKDLAFGLGNLKLIFDSLIDDVFPDFISKGLGTEDAMEKLGKRLADNSKKLKAGREDTQKLAAAEKRRTEGLEDQTDAVESATKAQEALNDIGKEWDTVLTDLHSEQERYIANLVRMGVISEEFTPTLADNEQSLQDLKNAFDDGDISQTRFLDQFEKLRDANFDLADANKLTAFSIRSDLIPAENEATESVREETLAIEALTRAEQERTNVVVEGAQRRTEARDQEEAARVSFVDRGTTDRLSGGVFEISPETIRLANGRIALALPGGAPNLAG